MEMINQHAAIRRFVTQSNYFATSHPHKPPDFFNSC